MDLLGYVRLTIKRPPHTVTKFANCRIGNMTERPELGLLGIILGSAVVIVIAVLMGLAADPPESLSRHHSARTINSLEQHNYIRQ